MRRRWRWFAGSLGAAALLLTTAVVFSCAPSARAATGAITEYRVTGAIPGDIVAGPDGNLWFTAVGTTGGAMTQIIVKLDPATGDMTQYAAGTGTWTAEAIVVGPDGGLWFTDQAVPAIGKVDPATGIVTEFTAAAGLNSGSKPVTLVAGPDGNLWFTDQGTTKAIGKVDLTTGTVAEYPVSGSPADLVAADGDLWFTLDGSTPAIGELDPATGGITYSTGLKPGSDPGGIVLGPDGNLWFTDSGTTPAIGKVDPATGGITEYTTVFNAGRQPNTIMAGPDNNLWFTDDGTTPAIGEVAPATGNVKEYSAGLNAGSQPVTLVAGSDGNLWFTDMNSTTPAIGSVDPGTGAISEYTAGLSAGSAPLYIVAGADDNLWFTDMSATPAIGKVYLAGPTIAGITPAQGPTTGGTTVTIAGTGLSVVSAVYFGTQLASFTLDTASSLTAVTPAGAAGTVSVSVYNPGGPGLAAFTYLAPASVSLDLTPATATPGSAVTVTGTVYDAQGDAIPGTTVDVALSGVTSVTAVTDSAGTYERAEKPG